MKVVTRESHSEKRVEGVGNKKAECGKEKKEASDNIWCESQDSLVDLPPLSELLNTSLLAMSSRLVSESLWTEFLWAGT